MVNVDNINKTIETMRKLNLKTVQFDMGTFATDIDLHFRPSPECGTACCLAGFAYIAKTGDIPNKFDDDVQEVAADFLGITDEASEELFLPSAGEAWRATLDEGIKMLENVRDNASVDWRFVYPNTHHSYECAYAVENIGDISSN